MLEHYQHKAVVVAVPLSALAPPPTPRPHPAAAHPRLRCCRRRSCPGVGWAMPFCDAANLVAFVAEAQLRRTDYDDNEEAATAEGRTVS